MTIDNKYKLGEIVYLKTDPEQLQRMMTGLKVCITGEILYELAAGTETTWHYEFEIKRDKTVF